MQATPISLYRNVEKGEMKWASDSHLSAHLTLPMQLTLPMLRLELDYPAHI